MKYLLTLIEFIWVVWILILVINSNINHPGWLAYGFGIICSTWASMMSVDWMKRYNIK